MRRFIRSALLLSASCPGLPLAAQDDAAWRGAWTADVDGKAYVLYLVDNAGAAGGTIDGTIGGTTGRTTDRTTDRTVSGTWCHDCSNADRIAFVDDGEVDSAGLHFNLYFSASDGSASVARADARIDGDTLHMRLVPPGSEASSVLLQRAPAWVEPPPRTAPAAPVRARELPGPAEMPTPDRIAGLWLTGSGPSKQYFNFKRHKGGVRGLVCGPCDDPHSFAPLENVGIDGMRFTFDIVHEDNGFGFAQHGPFRNVTTAQIAMNEMQMRTYASYEPDGPRIELTLLGPVRYMPEAKP